MKLSGAQEWVLREAANGGLRRVGRVVRDSGGSDVTRSWRAVADKGLVDGGAEVFGQMIPIAPTKSGRAWLAENGGA